MHSPFPIQNNSFKNRSFQNGFGCKTIPGIHWNKYEKHWYNKYLPCQLETTGVKSTQKEHVWYTVVSQIEIGTKLGIFPGKLENGPNSKSIIKAECTHLAETELLLCMFNARLAIIVGK